MDTAQQGSTSYNTGTTSTCDLEAIEQLTCTAKRFGRQAEVMNEVAPKLEEYRTQFAAARQKYTDAVNAATVDLDAIRKVLDELVEQLRCRLTDHQRECLEQAAESVFHDIQECSDPTGCQSPYDDTPAPDPETQTDSAALAVEIARRRANLAEKAAYFTALIAEPDTITQRVAWLKSEAESLAKVVAGGGDASKVARWYARWLILDYWATLSRIGHGFGSVASYVDCLCEVLKGLVSGWTTVAILEGRKAELDCYDTAKQQACQRKKDDTLQAILDAYEACCNEDNSETPNPEGPGPYGNKPTQAC
jgi:hypothetical protein